MEGGGLAGGSEIGGREIVRNLLVKAYRFYGRSWEDVVDVGFNCRFFFFSDGGCDFCRRGLVRLDSDRSFECLYFFT